MNANYFFAPNSNPRFYIGIQPQQAPATSTKNDPPKTKSLTPAPKQLEYPKQVTVCTPLFDETKKKSALKLWEGTHTSPEYKTFRVACNWKVRELIEALGGDKDYAMSECLEHGNGKWLRLATWSWKVHGDQTLESIGWGSTTMQPKWVVIDRWKGAGKE